jgi:hypothetical protein
MSTFRQSKHRANAEASAIVAASQVPAIDLYPKSTAALIRKVLKARFPACKFSVTTGRGSMVSSVDIEWTDGPSTKLVNSIVGKFQSGSFNGMTDSYDYDAKADRTFTIDGQAYVAGTRYVSTKRIISADLANKCIAKIAAFHCITGEIVVSAVPGYFGYDLVPREATHAPVRADLDWSHHSWYASIRRCAEDRTEFERRS